MELYLLIFMIPVAVGCWLWGKAVGVAQRLRAPSEPCNCKPHVDREGQV